MEHIGRGIEVTSAKNPNEAGRQLQWILLLTGATFDIKLGAHAAGKYLFLEAIRIDLNRVVAGGRLTHSCCSGNTSSYQRLVDAIDQG